MVLDETLIAEIVRRILSVSRPERVILFGSAASGRMTRDSDIDLLVVEADPQNPIAASVRIRASLRGLGHPFDVVVMSRARFEATRDLIGGLARPASRHGRVLYEAT